MGSKCKRLSHVVWTREYRYKLLFVELKELLDHDIRMLCEWKGCEVVELHVQPVHVHVVVSIPPKVSVSILLGTY